jgi:hypothetical protein
MDSLYRLNMLECEKSIVTTQESTASNDLLGFLM